jgi:hypothetical protein
VHDGETGALLFPWMADLVSVAAAYRDPSTGHDHIVLGFPRDMIYVSSQPSRCRSPLMMHIR